MIEFQSTPGAPADPPRQWPETSGITRAKDRPTLVVLAHPKCPCTRASIAELNRTMALAPSRIRGVVLFVVPRGLNVSPTETALWQEASAIPGVDVRVDAEGIEAGRFGVKTSGQALLYDVEGHLIFSGGITPGRGHAGDNAGRDAIVALARHQPAPIAETSVFGCALETPGAAPVCAPSK